MHERAVERAIRVIHGNYGEQIGVADMARAANYSRFHFTRLFYQVTGLTPRRFLVAVRLQMAKNLLTSTTLPVTDICHLVGYTSVGTFGSLFSGGVGLPPTAYRRFRGFWPLPSPVDEGALSGVQDSRPVVRGAISPAADMAAPVFVGIFPDRIPYGRPVSCAVLERPGPYVLTGVPEGIWYLLACAEGAERDPAAGDGRDRPYGIEAVSIGSAGPIIVHDGITRLADVRLRPMGMFDAPVVPALPTLRGLRSQPRPPRARSVA